MPELPDLTLYSENLTRRLSGQRLREFRVHSKKSIKGDPDDLRNQLGDGELISVTRHGKELVFNFDNRPSFSIHLMLKGFITIDQAPTEKPKIAIKFSAADFSLHDPMNWAKLTYPFTASGVPEPLSDEFTIDYLSSRLSHNHNMPLKTFLITQSEILGIGNAYADEILWAARIAPKSRCGALPKHVVVALHEQCGAVLRWAISELRRRTPDAISGEDRSFLVVHNGQERTPHGIPITKENVNGKSTYSTAEQELYL